MSLPPSFVHIRRSCNPTCAARDGGMCAGGAGGIGGGVKMDACGATVLLPLLSERALMALLPLLSERGLTALLPLSEQGLIAPPPAPLPPLPLIVESLDCPCPTASFCAGCVPVGTLLLILLEVEIVLATDGEMASSLPPSPCKGTGDVCCCGAGGSPRAAGRSTSGWALPPSPWAAFRFGRQALEDETPMWMCL